MGTKFICDQMLGRLAKWLRLMGYDTLYFKSIEDLELIRIAFEEKRMLFTRDNALMARRKIRLGEVKAFLIESDSLDAQLGEIAQKFELEKVNISNTLCSICNAPLTPISKSQVKGRVPRYVYETQQKFSTCPCCGRYYWKGTHWDKVNSKLNELFRGFSSKRMRASQKTSSSEIYNDNSDSYQG